MELSDSDKIRVIVSLQKLYIQNQIWEFSAYLREVGKGINKDLYNLIFQKSQELKWNKDSFYHVNNFDLDDYNFALSVIREEYKGTYLTTTHKRFQDSCEKLISILDNNKIMWRNIKIDKILRDDNS